MTAARRLAPTLGIVLLLSSCAPRKAGVELNTDLVSAPRLLELLSARGAQLRSMVGKGSVSFESPDVGGSAYFEMALKKPDSLLVKLEGPFGIGVGTFFLSRQRFVVYNSMENRVITGVPSDETIRAVLPFNLSYDQILDAFSGAFAIEQGAAAPRTYDVDGDRFHLAFDCGGRVCHYWIDPKTLLVTRYEVRDLRDRVIMHAESSAPTEQNDAIAPRRLSVSFPGEGRSVSIYYSSLALNPPAPSFAFSIPSNARTTTR